MFKEILTEADTVLGKEDTYSYKVIKTEKGSKYETPYWSIIFTPKDKSKEIVAFKDVLWYHAKSDGQYGLAMKDWTDGNDNGNSQPNMTTPYLYSSDSYLKMLVEILEGNYYKKDALEDEIYLFPPKTKSSEIKRQLS